MRFQGTGTEIVLEATDITANLDIKSEGTLFNIIQEAINNALKYAKAQYICFAPQADPRHTRDHGAERWARLRSPAGDGLL